MLENISTFRKRSPCHFTFERWSSGSLTDLGIKTRYYSIAENLNTIREHAVGYVEGERLWVRPKTNCYGVMFHHNGKHFWTHLTEKEFKLCFRDYLNL